MKLTIIERIQLQGLLPNEGDIITLRIVNDLKKELSFSEEEIKSGEIMSDPETNQVRWNPEKDTNKNVKLGDAALGLITDALKKLDKEKKLTAAHIPLWDKFVA